MSYFNHICFGYETVSIWKKLINFWLEQNNLFFTYFQLNWACV